MQQSRPIEVIQPTMRHAPRRRAPRLIKSMTLTNTLTVGAALLALALSVSLSAAADPDTCARPIDTTISAPCNYR